MRNVQGLEREDINWNSLYAIWVCENNRWEMDVLCPGSLLKVPGFWNRIEESTRTNRPMIVLDWEMKKKATK